MNELLLLTDNNKKMAYAVGITWLESGNVYIMSCIYTIIYLCLSVICRDVYVK